MRTGEVHFILPLNKEYHPILNKYQTGKDESSSIPKALLQSEWLKLKNQMQWDD